MLRLLLVILPLALVIYALIDCVRTPDDEMPVGIPKVVWVILIILFPGIAALAWIVVSRVARSEANATAGPRPGLWSSPPPPRPVRHAGPIAPDDDPAFLAGLESERRRADRERRRLERTANDGGAEGTADGTAAAGGGATPDAPGGAGNAAPELPSAEGNGQPRPHAAPDEDGPTTAGGTAPKQ